jgi:signal recognition particle receptor subunit beta
MCKLILNSQVDLRLIIDALDKVIQLKLVFFGPAMSGKTTSIKSLFDHFGKKENLASIETTTGRTLFFDYGTINFQNDNWKLKLLIFTSTGQDYYIGTRRSTLRNLDGLIFVADSQKNAYERNLISWDELIAYFGETLIKMPKVIAMNKQDLPDKFNITSFLKKINFDILSPYSKVTKTIALNGEGILESFEKILGLIFKELYGSQMLFDLA